MCKIKIFNMFLMCYCTFQVSYCEQQIRVDLPYKSILANVAYNKLVQQMRVIQEHSFVQLKDCNEMRFMFEETKEYEQGYVFGEIIERYRQMVGHVERCKRIVAYTVFDYLKYVELIQKLHLEIYNLVNMFHEIPRKYYEEPNFRDEGIDLSEDTRLYDGVAEELKIRQKQQEKEKREKKKMASKMRKITADIKMQDPVKRRPRNRYWPIEYGWEIQYYW